MFAKLLGFVVRSGGIRLIDGTGRSHLVGDGTPPTVTIRLTRRSLDLSLALNPSLSIGEAYMDGTLVVEQGTIYQFLDIVGRNADRMGSHAWLGLLAKLSGRIAQRNDTVRARRNVAHHYDLSDALYDIFLDADRHYSCAYFTSPDDTLETAQRNKQRHLASKLQLDRPGLRILDIGSGWGALGIYLAEIAHADVTGVTLSTEQHKFSNARATERGIDSRVRFALRDYREQRGQFDRIVSVGMFEHVGKRNYAEFFARLYDLLADDGVAVLHAIGDNGIPGPINPFIRKYIFPGADTPSLSEVFEVVERSGLIVTDLEFLRLHYARTLHLWRERFMARREEVVMLYDERFCRMWEFYLALCEVGFRHRSNIVFQMQLAKRNDTVPITRDAMMTWEQAHTDCP